MGEFHSDIIYGLDWLCGKAERVLDFGCGDGEMLHMCAKRGTKIHVGIDKAPMLVTKAIRRVDKSRPEKFYFRCGSVSEFRTLLPVSFDAVILSDILDLLPPEDGRNVLQEVRRVLDKKGKLLLKLSDYLSPEQMSAHYVNQKPVAWNLTSDEWKEVLGENFTISEFRDVYYKDHDKHERMFLLLKPEK